RRWHDPEVYDPTTRRQQAFAQRQRQFRTAQPRIRSHVQCPTALLQHLAANGLSDQAYAVRIQALADNATDIIGPEYTRIDDWCCCHDNLGRLAPMRAISSRASRALLAG